MTSTNFKKIILLLEMLTPVLFILGLAIDYYIRHGNCSGYHVGYCNNLENVNQAIAYCVFAMIYLFPFSLITYFLNDRIFRAWAWFATISVPMILIVPNFFDKGQDLIGLSDAFGAWFLLTVGYAFLSIAIILVQSIRVYWLKK